MRCRQLVSLAILLGSAAIAWGDAADDQYTVAATHYSRGRWKLAAKEFEAFLDGFPQHEKADVATFFLGESLVRLKRYRDARPHFLNFAARAAEHAFARQAGFRAAEMAYLTRDYETALRELRSFGNRYPDDRLNAYAFAYRGEIALDANDAEAAEAVYRQAIKQFPRGPLRSETRFGLARAVELQGNYDEALRFYQFLAANSQGPLLDDANLRTGVLLYKQKRYAEAIESLAIFQKTLADSPLQRESQYWRGMAMLGAGRPDEAVTIFESTDTKADDAEADKELAPRFAFGLGKAERERNNLEEAAESFRRVTTSWPDNSWADDAALALVELAFEMHDEDSLHNEAKAFRDNFADSPLAQRVEQLVGRAALENADFDLAIATFEKQARGIGKAASPAGRMSSYYLGIAYLGAGRDQEALEVFSEIDPAEDESVLRDNLAVARGAALVALQQYEPAVEPLLAYLASQPDGPDAPACRARLTICYAELGDFDSVREMLDWLESENVIHTSLWPTLIYVAEQASKQHETELARRCYTILAVDQAPGQYAAKGLAGLARLQLEAGETAESEKTFERLLKRATLDEDATKAGLERARMLAMADQKDAALATYRLVRERYPDSKDAVAATLGAAKLHDELDQDREARALLETLLDDESLAKQHDAALYRLAWVLTDLGELEKANNNFQRLVRDYPNSVYWADAAYRLAERSLQRGDRTRAAELVERLLDAELASGLLGHVLYLRGQIAAGDTNWEEVLQAMQRIVDEDLNESLRLPASYWIAEATYRKEDYENAGARFAQLDEATSGLRANWVPMVRLRRAQLWAHQKRWAEASSMCEQIAIEFPDFRQQYEVDYLLGRCLSAQARFSDARDAFAKVAKSPVGGRTETAAKAQWMIGESYFHQKRFRDAVRAYHRAASLYPYPQWQAASLLQAGKCHELQDEWREAVQLYAQLLQEHPETEYAEEASRRLRLAQQQASPRGTN